MSDFLCIDNQPTGSTQNFTINATIRVDTTSGLKDLIIRDDATCNTESVGSQAPVKPDDVLHLVFLVDTSDSFNKLDSITNGAAGTVILEKLIDPLIRSGLKLTTVEIL